LVTILLTPLAGCWQEVHYGDSMDPPAGSSATDGGSRTLPAGDASAFADELVAALMRTAREMNQADQREAGRPAATDSPAIPVPAQPSISVGPMPIDSSANAAVPNDLAPKAERPSPLGDRYQVPSGGSTADSAGPLQTEPILESNQPTGRGEEQPPRPVSLLSATHPASEAAETRRAAWQLGNNWSLAALARDRVTASDNVARWLDHSHELAASLGTRLAELPPPVVGDAEASTRVVIKHLFTEGTRIGNFLSDRYGPDHAALFELGVKANLLLVLYEPRTPLAETLASAIAKAREQAKTSVDLWQPLLTAIAEGREPAAVRQAVFRAHEEVARSLAGAADRQPP
jgi:hypothetical protein